MCCSACSLLTADAIVQNHSGFHAYKIRRFRCTNTDCSCLYMHSKPLDTTAAVITTTTNYNIHIYRTNHNKSYQHRKYTWISIAAFMVLTWNDAIFVHWLANIIAAIIIRAAHVTHQMSWDELWFKWEISLPTFTYTQKHRLPNQGHFQICSRGDSCQVHLDEWRWFHPYSIGKIK